MGSIPFVPEPTETIGKITGVTLADGQFGKQIQVSILPVNPEAVNERLFWFKVSSKSNSKWMNFVTSFNAALLNLDSKRHPAISENDMVNTWVRIVELEKSGVVNGEQRKWTEPSIAEAYATQEAALAIWQVKQPVAEESTPETPTPEAKPEPPFMPVNPAVIPILQKSWVASGQNPDAFWELVKSWGYTKEQVLEAVK